MTPSPSVPGRAWVVTAAGMSVNLCLGILYAWSIWKKHLVAPAGIDPGTPMSGLNEGWVYLNNAESTWAYCICGLTFALFMIPGGRLQDRYGPRIGATLGGLCLALGCVVAGLMKSYTGLLVGFGLLGGIGMGFGYAAATPAAVKWFGPARRGLIVGLVVGGYGGAAIYIAPLAERLIDVYGITGSFVGLGALFAVVVIVAGRLLAWPPAGYAPPASQQLAANRPAVTTTDWPAAKMLKTWQFFALVFLMFGSAQSGILVIANAALELTRAAGAMAFFAANAWILASFGGFMNATGRIGTGLYSDRLGRVNAYTTNGLAALVCLCLTPWAVESKNVPLLFVLVGVVFWQYGGTLSLLPALTADYFGPKNLGLNYGLVFLGWGAAFFVPQLGAYIKGATGSLNAAYYLSAGLLLAAVVLSRFLKRPPG